MKLVTDKPFGLRGNNFICMGIISDSDKDYACLLQLDTKQLYIEEIHWGAGKNIHTATLHFVEDEKEWIALYNFVTTSTTIFSPYKINEILKQPEFYFYSSEYRKTEDYEKRKRKKLL